MAVASGLISQRLVPATGSVRADPLWRTIASEIGRVGVDAFSGRQ